MKSQRKSISLFIRRYRLLRVSHIVLCFVRNLIIILCSTHNCSRCETRFAFEKSRIGFVSRDMHVLLSPFDFSFLLFFQLFRMKLFVLFLIPLFILSGKLHSAFAHFFEDTRPEQID